jgi:hypothetical protein
MNEFSVMFYFSQLVPEWDQCVMSYDNEINGLSCYQHQLIAWKIPLI